jgi:hypothetical protein
MYFQKVKIQNIYLGCLEATYEKSWIRILSPIRICICNSSVLKWQRSTTLLKLSPLCHCIKYPISVKKWYIWEYLASIQLKEMTNYVPTLQASELLIVGHQTNKLIGKNIFSFLFYTSLGILDLWLRSRNTISYAFRYFWTYWMPFKKNFSTKGCNLWNFTSVLHLFSLVTKP